MYFKEYFFFYIRKIEIPTNSNKRSFVLECEKYHYEHFQYDQCFFFLYCIRTKGHLKRTP